MEIVQAFKTVDGQLFEDRELADEHERVLRFRAAVQQLADDVATDGREQELISTLFFEHIEAVREVLAELDGDAA
jgi:hypothetical protein